MILGIGVDVVHVGRIRHWVSGRASSSASSIPTRSRKRGAAAPARPLPGRPIRRQGGLRQGLGHGLAGVRLGDIQVVNDPSGRPDIVLHGTALARFGAVGGARVHVSLTHESDNAIAIAIIER